MIVEPMDYLVLDYSKRLFDVEKKRVKERERDKERERQTGREIKEERLIHIGAKLMHFNLFTGH